MKQSRYLLAFLLCLIPVAARAQAPQATATTPDQPASLRTQLMPTGDALRLQAPAHAEESVAKVSAGAQAARGGDFAYMIAGGALFVAGLLVGGDAGTILVLAGAGIGAYGIYLHFR